MKKVISFILSVVLAFSCCAVMAMAEEPVYYSYDGEKYEFAGELTDKATYGYEIDKTRVCYELNAKEAGIYKITISRGGYLEYGFSVFGSIDKRNSFYNEKELTEDWSYDETYVFINMEENEKCYIAIEFYPYEEELKNGKAELNFTYSGNIKEVYTAPSIKEEVYENEDRYYYYYSTAVIVMDNDACYVDLNTESDKILNSVKFDFDFTDKSYSETVDVVSISKYVKSIELPKDFEPSCTLEYPGYYVGEAYPEYIKISFTDGTSVSVEPNTGFSLPGIDYVKYYVYMYYDEGKFLVGVASYEKEFDATVTKEKSTDTIKNIFVKLFYNIKDHLRWLINDVANLFPDKYQIYELFRDFGSTLLIGIRTIGSIINFIGM